MYVGKLADPDWRRERARKAAAASHSVSSYIERIRSRSSELTTEDIEDLRALAASVRAAA